MAGEGTVTSAAVAVAAELVAREQAQHRLEEAAAAERAAADVHATARAAAAAAARRAGEVEWRELADSVAPLRPALARETFALAPHKPQPSALPGGGGGALPGARVGERICVPALAGAEEAATPSPKAEEAAVDGAAQRTLNVAEDVDPARRGQLPLPERCAGVVVVGAATARVRTAAARLAVDGAAEGNNYNAAPDEGEDVAEETDGADGAGAQDEAQRAGTRPGESIKGAVRKRRPLESWPRRDLNARDLNTAGVAPPEYLPEYMPERSAFGLSADVGGISARAGAGAPRLSGGRPVPLGGSAGRPQQGGGCGGELLAPSEEVVRPHARAAVMGSGSRFGGPAEAVEEEDLRPLPDPSAPLALRRSAPSAAFAKAARFGDTGASGDEVSGEPTPDLKERGAADLSVSYAAVERASCVLSFGKAPPRGAGRGDYWIGCGSDSTGDEEAARRRAEADLERDIRSAHDATLKRTIAATFSSVPRFAPAPDADSQSESGSSVDGVGASSSGRASPVSTLDAWNKGARLLKPRSVGGLILPEGSTKSKRSGGSERVVKVTNLNPNYDTIKRAPAGVKMAPPSAKPKPAGWHLAHSRVRRVPGPGQYDYSLAMNHIKPRCPGAGAAWTKMRGRSSEPFTPAESLDASFDGSVVSSVEASPVSMLDAARALDAIRPRIKGVATFGSGRYSTGHQGRVRAKQDGEGTLGGSAGERSGTSSSAEASARAKHETVRFALVERRVVGGSWGPRPVKAMQQPRARGGLRAAHERAAAAAMNRLSLRARRDDRDTVVSAIPATDALLATMDPARNDSLVRTRHPAWTFAKSDGLSLFEGPEPPPPRGHQWLHADDRVVRQRPPAFAFLSAKRGLLEKGKPLDPREAAVGQYHSGLERAWARLQRTVPSAMFGAAAERWANSGWAGGFTSGKDRDEGPSELSIDQLEAAVRATLPGAPAFSFVPVAFSQWQQRGSVAGDSSGVHGAIVRAKRRAAAMEGQHLWLDVTPGVLLTKRRTATPVAIGLAQERFSPTGTKSRFAGLEDKAELGRYDVGGALDATEVSIKGGSFGRASRGIGHSAEGAPSTTTGDEEDVPYEMAADIMRALGAVLPHHGTAVHMRPPAGAEGTSFDAASLTADIDFVSGEALDASRTAVPVPTFPEAQRWTERAPTIEDYKVGPGVYFDGIDQYFSISSAVDGRGPTFPQAPTGRGIAQHSGKREGDILRLDVSTADAHRFPSTPAVIIGHREGPVAFAIDATAQALRELSSGAGSFGEVPPPGSYDADVGPTRRTLAVSVPNFALDAQVRLPELARASEYRDTPLDIGSVTTLSEHRSEATVDFGAGQERFPGVSAEVLRRARREGDRLDLNVGPDAIAVLRDASGKGMPGFAFGPERFGAEMPTTDTSRLDYADGASAGEEFLRAHVPTAAHIEKQVRSALRASRESSIARPCKCARADAPVQAHANSLWRCGSLPFDREMQRPRGWTELPPDPYGHDTLDGGSYDVKYTTIDKAVAGGVNMAADNSTRAGAKDEAGPAAGDALDIEPAAARDATLPSAPAQSFGAGPSREALEPYVDVDEGNTLVLSVPSAAMGRLLQETKVVGFDKQLPRGKTFVDVAVDEAEGNDVLMPLDVASADDRRDIRERRIKGEVRFAKMSGRPQEALLPDERMAFTGGGAFGDGGALIRACARAGVSKRLSECARLRPGE